METGILIWTMIAIVGTVGVIKNLINRGGKKVWTLITVIVGMFVAIIAEDMPIKTLQIWVAVTGATLFYDTIFKAFQRLIERIAEKKE